MYRSVVVQMLPEWTLPYFTENYTGPYLSDGRFQSSVEGGQAPPRSQLDALSREHDTSYARSRRAQDRRKADLVYYRATRKMGWFPRLAGDIVLYGNDPARLFGFGHSGSAGSSSLGGGGENMGNENGRERAQRLRVENGQDNLRKVATVDTLAPAVCYMPDGSLHGEQPLGYSYNSNASYDPGTANSSQEYIGHSLGGGKQVSSALRPRRRRRLHR